MAAAPSPASVTSATSAAGQGPIPTELPLSVGFRASSWSQLPLDLGEAIINLLPTPDVLSCALVNKRWCVWLKTVRGLQLPPDCDYERLKVAFNSSLLLSRFPAVLSRVFAMLIVACVSRRTVDSVPLPGPVGGVAVAGETGQRMDQRAWELLDGLEEVDVADLVAATKDVTARSLPPAFPDRSSSDDIFLIFSLPPCIFCPVFLPTPMSEPKRKARAKGRAASAILLCKFFPLYDQP